MLSPPLGYREGPWESLTDSVSTDDRVDESLGRHRQEFNPVSPRCGIIACRSSVLCQLDTPRLPAFGLEASYWRPRQIRLFQMLCDTRLRFRTGNY